MESNVSFKTNKWLAHKCTGISEIAICFSLLRMFTGKKAIINQPSLCLLGTKISVNHYYKDIVSIKYTNYIVLCYPVVTSEKIGYCLIIPLY